ncbi:tail fiber domain-containing protein, partial [bacterium]|nr:tail fiber domain-containing protein [bacterium]
TTQTSAAGSGAAYWTVSGDDVYNSNSGNVGINQSSPSTQLHIGGTEGLLVQGTYDSGTSLTLGAGTRMHFYPKKSAFRAGYVDGTQWDDANIGNYSTATGYNTTASGDYSTALGNYVSTNGLSGSFVIGDQSTTTVMTPNYANQMRMRFAYGVDIYTSSDYGTYVSVGAGGNSWFGPSDSTKKENFQLADGEYFLNSISTLRLGSWNYKAQDPSTFRHYGPMAQDIFHYFGRDDYGTIGNDTTLATADMDGIMMIALQALEKRTKEQQVQIDDLKAQNKMLMRSLSHTIESPSNSGFFSRLFSKLMKQDHEPGLAVTAP